VYVFVNYFSIQEIIDAIILRKKYQMGWVRWTRPLGTCHFTLVWM